ncbi:cytochrome c biogenesis protein CcsA [Portibacter marinus]|uniref:cytochrome c biogenesis protein CcsA n=1 Tax=Portibacter marinus TaxID=2898660 RepID=UPI001F1A43E2|nr:cytochrome c biogenesis protein CcsA [Portibacter marinus]
MKGSWWKILSVVLMLYVIVVGFLMPLKPGIVNVTPQNLNSGEEVTLEVELYNADITEQNKSQIRAWLIRDTTYILQSQRVNVVNDQLLEIDFNLPEHLPTDEEVMAFTLVVDAPDMGSSVLPSGIFVGQSGGNQSLGAEAWSRGGLVNLSVYKGFGIPYRNLLAETLRNTYFHVSLWFAMFILYFVSVIYSIRYLRKREVYFDQVGSSLVEVGTLFGILGLITGAIWAKNTWGTYWTADVKLNMAAISMMIYAAYLVLRISLADADKRAIISSSYNIFAFFIIIPLIFVIPRLTDSLHPGNGGNPGFGGEDMDNTMRMVFYPAILAFTLLGLWMANLMMRYKRIRNKLDEI